MSFTTKSSPTNLSPLRFLRVAIAAATAAVVLAACSGTTSEQRNITLTFIRHAESQGNADGVADTTVPGPALTGLGQEQADKLANKLADSDYDGVYASQMVRTQQTAAPVAKELGEQVTVLPGLNEISAGWFEGVSMEEGSSTILLGPQGWLHGDRRYGIPGSVDGDQFNDAFGAAVQKIYDSGEKNPVAFSSGLAIMMWTLLNSRNGRAGLLEDHPLPNTGRVVITGNPFTGWTLRDWDGITDFGPDAA